jgi:hypothetical protein
VPRPPALAASTRSLQSNAHFVTNLASLGGPLNALLERRYLGRRALLEALKKDVDKAVEAVAHKEGSLRVGRLKDEEKTEDRDDERECAEEQLDLPDMCPEHKIVDGEEGFLVRTRSRLLHNRYENVRKRPGKGRRQCMPQDRPAGSVNGIAGNGDASELRD